MFRSLLAALMLAFGMIHAQEGTPSRAIGGRVVDARTHEALPNVNVFLANTTRGAATNLKGEFVIRNVPAGTYEIVVSMVGYERQIQRVRLVEEGPHWLEIKLHEKVFETPTIEVVARDPVEWRNSLNRFRRLFLGETENSERCRLVNPEILDFTVDKQKGRFEAKANEPLVIENRALGYMLEFVVQLFVAEERVFKYGGVTRFEELTTENEQEREQWEVERKRAFRGSLRHFLLALVQNKIHEEEFGISLMVTLPLKSSDIIPREIVKEKDILAPGRFPYERTLRFSNYLRIEYRGESPERGFLGSGDGEGRTPNDPLGDRYQVSWLSLDFIDVRLNTEGNLYDPFNVRTYGYWSFERIGEWLPLEYRPADYQ